MAARCPNGHGNRVGAAFCDECGAAIDEDAGSAPTPGRHRRRWLVGAAVGLVLLVGVGVVVVVSGGSDEPDSAAREADYLVAVRTAAPDTTSTLSDAELLDTARSICDRAADGDVMSEAEIQQLATDFEVSLDEVSAPVRLSIEILCPENRSVLDEAWVDLDSEASPAPSVTTTESQAPSTTQEGSPSTTAPMSSSSSCRAGEPGFPTAEPGFGRFEDAARCALDAWRSGDEDLIATYLEPDAIAVLGALPTPSEDVRVESCFGNTGIGCDVVGDGGEHYSFDYLAAGQATPDDVPMLSGISILGLPPGDPVLYGAGLGGAHLGDDFDDAVAALTDALGPSDAELFSGCPTLRQVAWGEAGVFIQAQDGETVSHIRVFQGSSGQPPATLGATGVGQPFDDVRSEYAGDVTDLGYDMYGNRFTFDTGANAGVYGFYDPDTAEAPITELGIGMETCGD